VIAVYAISVVLGFLGIISWVFLGLTASAVAGKSALDPEEKFGERGRVTVAATLGFGLGGMSASFAGWGTTLSVVGAIAGATLAVVSARYLGFDEDEGGDPA
jgi:hypothetical protein